VLTNHGKGRPILIGTTSVDQSEEVFVALKDLGVRARVLNAKPENVERESEVVAQAGRLGAVTVATNMAGRGTDILLGGNAKGTAKVLAKYMMLVHTKLISAPPALDDGDAPGSVTVTDKSEADAEGNFSGTPQVTTDEVEEDLLGETDPDVVALPTIAAIAKSRDLWMPLSFSKSAELALKQAVVSCGDELGEAPTALDIEDFVARAADNVPTDNVAVRLLRSAIGGLVKELEPIIKNEQAQVKRLGGLYVIGTSRHESRRIDNQLRGRAGRQGDPGGSRFFLSLEDDMFKV